MLTGLFHRKLKNITRGLPQEEFEILLRITKANVRLLNSILSRLQSTIGTVNPRRNKTKYADLQSQISFVKRRLEEEENWQREFTELLNKHNNGKVVETR